ncbi:MAG: hypothetical protein PHS57_06260 [Alphaproteobacteria bacterium]|nr:hypothetical protein [Alphaproteobacteria bacterium]
MAGFHERLMESGCEMDYRRSLVTPGDMTYADPDWLDDWTPESADEPSENEIDGMIDTLRRLGYTVKMQ